MSSAIISHRPMEFNPAINENENVVESCGSLENDEGTAQMGKATRSKMPIVSILRGASNKYKESEEASARSNE
jgi:hypothetical protein